MHRNTDIQYPSQSVQKLEAVLSGEAVPSPVVSSSGRYDRRLEKYFGHRTAPLRTLVTFVNDLFSESSAPVAAFEKQIVDDEISFAKLTLTFNGASFTANDPRPQTDRTIESSHQDNLVFLESATSAVAQFGAAILLEHPEHREAIFDKVERTDRNLRVVCHEALAQAGRLHKNRARQTERHAAIA